MGGDNITKLLTILLGSFMVILFVLIFVYIMVYMKSKQNNKEKGISSKNKQDTSKRKEANNYNSAASIYDFMEFEDIQDNMIVQKDKFKYIMVVECQGVNYDLMSEVEKNSIEEGFLQFLNTIRHPIQLYIQTRTVNLENSINTYKRNVSEIEKDLLRKRQEYYDAKDNPNISDSKKQEMFYRVVKQSNLYEYGKDIIADTERMSLNQNILSKKYYVIIPYYPSDVNDERYDSNEVRNMAFSELYTRAQAVIRTLSVCGVQGKILNSRELIELLYVAYNRDHEEDFNLDRAVQAQYDKLYTTSEDVYKKKVASLDKKIEEEAVKKAKEKIDIAKSDLEKKAEEKEKQLDQLIDEMAKIILENNKKYVGEDIVEEAIKDIEQDAEKRKRGRPKKEVSK